MTKPRFTCLGKEVLFDGQHYADACGHMAAAAIAHAMNSPCARKRMIPDSPESLPSSNKGRAE